MKELPSFDLVAFDQLEDYALALSFAHTNYLTMVQPPDDLLTVAATASKMRARLSCGRDCARAARSGRSGAADTGQ